jgi:hypothetical protein
MAKVLIHLARSLRKAGTQLTRFVFSKNYAVCQILAFFREENLVLAGNETMDRNCVLTTINPRFQLSLFQTHKRGT